MAIAWTSAEVRSDKISPTYDVDVDGDKIAEMHFLALDFKQVFFSKSIFSTLEKYKYDFVRTWKKLNQMHDQ